MARYAPQSQTHDLMAQKQELAQRLLGRGLTITQIASQLRCSRYFVQQVRDRARSEEDLVAAESA